MSALELKDAKRIFDQAVELSMDQRAAFLECACGSNPDLRQRVESMLQEFEKTSGAVEDPWIDNPSFSPAESNPATYAPGERLGPYEILTPIGAGGMGQVFKARDMRLDRIVAIKVSMEKFSERFEREAQAIAALSHPNICQIHDVGPNFLVMEYIEGKPLAGPVPFEEAVRLAGQIADALDAVDEYLPRFNGYSIGKWEGNTLVLDTVGLDDRAWMDHFGYPVSDQAKLQERWHRTSYGILELTMVLTDPKIYTEPWKTEVAHFSRIPKEALAAGVGWAALAEDRCVPLDEVDTYNKQVRNPAGGVK
jgi:hypothetical protein